MRLSRWAVLSGILICQPFIVTAVSVGLVWHRYVIYDFEICCSWIRAQRYYHDARFNCFSVMETILHAAAKNCCACNVTVYITLTYLAWYNQFLFLIISSSFGVDMVRFSKEKLVKSREILAAGPQSATVLETALVTLAHLALYSEAVEVEVHLLAFC